MADNVIGFFNLLKKGDEAVVRLLHTSIKTIESAVIHRVSVGDKRKSVKCTGVDCPLCGEHNACSNRVYIHLWDYTDNTEKVWNRTDKIIPQLEAIEKDWGDLCNLVVRITRDTDEFPKYTVSILPSKNYSDVNEELIDQKIAYRFYMTRSRDELIEFIKTRVMPSHKSTYVSKEEYFKNKNNQSNNDTKIEMNYTSKESPAFEDVDDDSLPF